MAMPAERAEEGVRGEERRVCQVQLLRGTARAEGSKDSGGVVEVWEAGMWTARVGGDIVGSGISERPKWYMTSRRDFFRVLSCWVQVL